MIPASIRVPLAVAVSLFACTACGGAREEGEQGDLIESSAGGAAASSDAPTGPWVPASFAGSIVLANNLASNAAGAVFVNVYRAGDAGKAVAVPYLSRRYEIDDLDWTVREGASVRYFGLNDRDRVGDPKLSLPTELEIEASYSADGSTIRGRGVYRTVLPIRNGQAQVELSIRPKAGDPTATITPGKGG